MTSRPLRPPEALFLPRYRVFASAAVGVGLLLPVAHHLVEMARPWAFGHDTAFTRTFGGPAAPLVHGALIAAAAFGGFALFARTLRTVILLQRGEARPGEPEHAARLGLTLHVVGFLVTAAVGAVDGLHTHLLVGLVGASWSFLLPAALWAALLAWVIREAPRGSA